jgi:hypothetical protein
MHTILHPDHPYSHSPATCNSRTSTAASTVTITTAGSATLRVTWGTGNALPVYTNICTYNVTAAAVPPTTTADPSPTVTPKPSSAAFGAAALGSQGGLLLATALASVLPLLQVSSWFSD